MAVVIWVVAVLAGFAQAVGIFVAIWVAIHGLQSGLVIAVTLLGAALAGIVAYGHLVFLALFYRRLRRQGHDLRIPKSIAKALGRVLDGLGYAI